VSYADYALSVPSPLQVLLSIAVTAGICIGLVWIFHPHLIRIANGPPRDPDDPAAKSPSADSLIDRIIQVATFGFIFLFTFTVGQFMITTRGAESATQGEVQYFARAMASAQELPADAGREPAVAALNRYRTIILEEQWPLLQEGNLEGAYLDQIEAAQVLADGTRRALSAGAADAPSWGVLSSSVNEMLDSAADLLSAVPTRAASTLVLTVILLGTLSLALTAVFLPTRLRLNLLLIGLMGATYGFLFYIVVELSNPFEGTGGISPFTLITP
jgi:hypothetical protein